MPLPVIFTVITFYLMKNILDKITFTLVVYFLVSCVTTAKVQRASVVGSPRLSVVKITNQNTPNRFHFNLQYSQAFDDSIKMNVGGHTKVNESGIFEVQPVPGEEYFYSDPKVNRYNFKAKNIFWKIPQSHFLFEAEKTFDNLSLGIGFNISTGNYSKFYSNNFRIGVFENYELFGWRIDLLIHRNQLLYDIDYITYLSDYQKLERVIFHSATENKTEWNHELSFSINTSKSDWLLNYFFTLNFGNQGLYNLLDEEGDLSGLEYQDQFRNVLFGVYKQIDEKHRIILGLRINSHHEIGNEVIIPGFILQYDFSI